MTDSTKTDAEKQETAHELKPSQEQRPRGGAHGREDDTRQHEAPPPLEH